MQLNLIDTDHYARRASSYRHQNVYYNLFFLLVSVFLILFLSLYTYITLLDPRKATHHSLISLVLFQSDFLALSESFIAVQRSRKPQTVY